MAPAKEISLDNAKQNKLFYFVANVVVFRRSDSTCLILKRSATEKVHPSKYAVPGGKLEWKDMDMDNPSRMNGDVFDFENAMEDLLKRETLEEAGITIKEPFTYINSVAFIRPDGIPVILLKFAAEYNAGTVVLEEGAFTDYAWVSADDVDKYDCIQGVADEVKQTIAFFHKR